MTEPTPPDWTVLAAPDLHADPKHDGTRTEVFVVTHLARRLILVGGTHYAGEIKKAIFAVMNDLLPQRGVFPMHCAANVGRGGDDTLFAKAAGAVQFRVKRGRKMISIVSAPTNLSKTD